MGNRKHDKVEAAEINNNKVEKIIVECRSSINY